MFIHYIQCTPVLYTVYKLLFSCRKALTGLWISFSYGEFLRCTLLCRCIYYVRVIMLFYDDVLYDFVGVLYGFVGVLYGFVGVLYGFVGIHFLQNMKFEVQYAYCDDRCIAIIFDCVVQCKY